MIITTTNSVPGRETAEVLNVVHGSTVRARNAIKDIGANLKNIIGGELKQYTNLQTAARKQAMERMIAEAEKLGADAILNLRLSTSVITQGASEILAYGTAVKLK